VGFTSSQTAPHTDLHNRKNHPSLWDTLAHRRHHIQTYTTGRTTRLSGIYQHTDTIQHEESPFAVGYASAETVPNAETHKRNNHPSLGDKLAHRRDHILNTTDVPPVTVGYTSSQTAPHTDLHNWKNHPSLWDTLAHRRHHIQTHTKGITTRHCGIH
jgi:hypothetical protein